ALFPLRSSSGRRRDLPSFPTRRSSDLKDEAVVVFGQLHRVFDLLDQGGVEALQAANVLQAHPLAVEFIQFFINHLFEDGHQPVRSEEHTSELQSRENLVCRLLLEKKKL